MRSKDYKTNLLHSFTNDHLVKHHLAYQVECISGPAIQSLATLEEKDRHYAECSNNFMRRLKHDIT